MAALLGYFAKHWPKVSGSSNRINRKLHFSSSSQTALFFTDTHNKLPGHARLSLALHCPTVFSPTREYIQIHKAVDFARLKSTASYSQQTRYVSTPWQSPLRSTGHSSYLVHLLASSSSNSSCCEITCIGNSNE